MAREDHLATLRTLLRGDFLRTAVLDEALAGLARVVKEALPAREAMVALWEGEGWTATTSRGRRLSRGQIRQAGSRSVLERVRQQERPLWSAEDDLSFLTGSASVAAHDLKHFLAVPLWLFDLEGRAERGFGGCLYADRGIEGEPFGADDAELVSDIALLAQPALDVLRRLGRLETDLLARQEEISELRQTLSGGASLSSYETRDPRFAAEVIRPLVRVARAHRVGLLISGPTGSGKTQLARAYHQACARSSGPFITLDCAQITSAETLTAELFGYAPGSGYANAPAKGRPGKAELADGGTLFIDEVATIPPALQQRLLRLIQEGEFSRLGDSATHRVDLQVIAATNADLRAMVAEGRFREDLFWRLNELAVRLPTLDQRPADVPLLAERFLADANERFGRRDDRIEGFTPAAMRRLVGYPWSREGNLRGLLHCVSRSVLMAPDGVARLDAGDLQLPEASEEHARGEGRDGLKALLEAKIAAHGGVVASMATDPEVASALAGRAALPATTLASRLERMGLRRAAAAERQRRREALSVDRLVAAVVDAGSGARAAERLGITRDALVYRLRRAGRGIREILESGE